MFTKIKFITTIAFITCQVSILNTYADTGKTDYTLIQGLVSTPVIVEPQIEETQTDQTKLKETYWSEAEELNPPPTNIPIDNLPEEQAIIETENIPIIQSESILPANKFYIFQEQTEVKQDDSPDLNSDWDELSELTQSTLTQCQLQNNEISNDPALMLSHINTLIKHWSKLCYSAATTTESHDLYIDSYLAGQLSRVITDAKSQIAQGLGAEVVQELLDHIIYIEPSLIDDYLCTLHGASKQYLQLSDSQAQANPLIQQVYQVLTEALLSQVTLDLGEVEELFSTDEQSTPQEEISSPILEHTTSNYPPPTSTPSSPSSLQLPVYTPHSTTTRTPLEIAIAQAEALQRARRFQEAIDILEAVPITQRSYATFSPAFANAFALWLRNETGPTIPPSTSTERRDLNWRIYMLRWDSYARRYEIWSGRAGLPPGVTRPTPPNSVVIPSVVNPPVVTPPIRPVTPLPPLAQTNRRPCAAGYTQTDYFCLRRQDSNLLPSSAALVAELDSAVRTQNNRFAEGRSTAATTQMLNSICSPQRCEVNINAAPGGCNGATRHNFNVNGNIGTPSSIELGLLSNCRLPVTWQSVVQHEVTHLVSVYYIRGPIPRWADEGMAILAENAQVIASNWINFSRSPHFESPQHNIMLFLLLRLQNYPQNIGALYTSGAMLTQFFIEDGARHPASIRNGFPRFIDFLNRFYLLGNNQPWFPRYSQSLRENYPAYTAGDNQTQSVGIPLNIINEMHPTDRNNFIEGSTPGSNNQRQLTYPANIVNLYRQFREYYYRRANRVLPALN